MSLNSKKRISSNSNDSDDYLNDTSGHDLPLLSLGTLYVLGIAFYYLFVDNIV